MIELSVQVDGDTQVLARFAGMTDAIRIRLRAAFEKFGPELRDTAAANAPSRTGKLRQSIKSRIVERGDQIQLRVGPPVFYGRFQETGLDTMRKPPRHRGIAGVRTRPTKAGGVLVSARRGLMRREAGWTEHPFHLPAHPFMTPAFASLRDRITAGILDAVKAGSQD